MVHLVNSNLRSPIKVAIFTVPIALILLFTLFGGFHFERRFPVGGENEIIRVSNSNFTYDGIVIEKVFQENLASYYVFIAKRNDKINPKNMCLELKGAIPSVKNKGVEIHWLSAYSLQVSYFCPSLASKKYSKIQIDGFEFSTRVVPLSH